MRQFFLLVLCVMGMFQPQPAMATPAMIFFNGGMSGANVVTITNAIDDSSLKFFRVAAY